MGVVKTVGIPADYIIPYIIGNPVSVMDFTDDMVVKAFLPSKLNVIPTRIHGYGLLVSANNHAKCRSLRRDAPRCIRRFGYSDDCMYMIGHNNEYRNFNIPVMSGKSSKTLVCNVTNLTENHFTVSYLSKIVFFPISADCYEIVTTGIIMKHCAYVFAFRHPGKL